jgi:hypothetical protein
MRVPKWLRVSLPTVAAMLLLLLGGGLAYSRWAFPPGPEVRCDGHGRFEANVWRDSVQAFGPLAVRGCMVDALLAERSFHGLPRAEVVALLGEPGPTDYFREYDLVYWLGPERGLVSIDSEWLVFRLDGRGRVAEYRLVAD